METTLQKTNWQNKYISMSYIASLLLSCVIILIILLIPIKHKQYNASKALLKLTLSKGNLQQRFKKKENKQNHPKTEKLTPKINQAINTKKVKNKSTINKRVKNTKEILLRKPIKLKEKKPNSSDISKWIKNYQSLEEVSLDFQTKNDKFIYKNIVIPKQNRLVIENKLAKNLNVDNPDSLLVSATKKSIGFFSALDEPKKTVDSIPYCALWGRRSFHCPGKSL